MEIVQRYITPLKSIRRTTLLFVLCLSFLLGIGLAHSGYAFGWPWALLTGCGSLVTLRKRNAITLAWIVLFGLTLGWWRGSVYMMKLADYQALFGQKITISVHATNDAVYGKNTQLTFDAKQVTILNTDQKLAGKIGVSGFGLPAVYQGDVVQATGKLTPSLGSYQAKMSFAALKLNERRPSLIGQIRRQFAAGMQTSLPEPVASFGMGLLIGQRNTLPPDVTQTLLMVGLAHIIAVSGYNLTILLRAARRILGEYSKRQTLLFSLLLIAAFLLLAGSSASIVRAALVSTLSIIAGYYGRSIKPLVLILLAAAITAFANPFYVWTDTGWYLSFLAFFGIMVLAPLIQARLSKRLRKSLIASVALESFCAEIMTLPYVLYIFGQISFISLIANILVVALVPLAMLLSAIAGLAGMLLPAVAGWFAWPARILLTYMLDIANALSHIPDIFVQGLSLEPLQLAALYVVIAGTCGLLWYKNRNQKLSFEEQQDDKEWRI